jgi:hypothetical protein
MAVALLAQSPVSQNEARQLVEQLHNRLESIDSFRFDFEWQNPVGYSGQVERNVSGWRIRIVPADRERAGLPREFLYDGDRWRNHLFDDAGNLTQVILNARNPVIIGDFSPLEAFGFGITAGEKGEWITHILRTGEFLSAWREEKSNAVHVEVRFNRSRYDVSIGAPPAVRFLGYQNHLEFDKRRPAPIRFIHVVRFELEQGVFYPAETSMGYVDLFEDMRGKHAWSLRIASFDLNPNLDVKRIVKEAETSGVDIRDDRTGTVRKGALSGKRASQRAKAASGAVVEDAAKALEHVTGQAQMDAKPPAKRFLWFRWGFVGFGAGCLITAAGIWLKGRLFG